ncbi:hypothetical protein RND71_014894 [Anisodus tanguticus]|uniref:Uncharacterized protein n=1 Tax=Anisodus tanguticus TaxID=243964 RepID=A0AAE1VN60_9SOLA|nr:hypothetical protein RND71_014894 [Anisodus tanguticus]
MGQLACTSNNFTGYPSSPTSNRNWSSQVVDLLKSSGNQTMGLVADPIVEMWSFVLINVNRSFSRNSLLQGCMEDYALQIEGLDDRNPTTPESPRSEFRCTATHHRKSAAIKTELTHRVSRVGAELTKPLDRAVQAELTEPSKSLIVDQVRFDFDR